MVGFGVELSSAEAVLEATEIRQVASFADGFFGDGVLAAGGDLGTTVAVRGCRIADAARASLANFGAHAIVQTTAFECAPIHLNGEVFDDQPYFFDNEGGNSCGCGEDQHGCKALSSSLEPPGPAIGGGPGEGEPPPDTFDELGPAEP
ncbi:MAG: hypothetical protein JRI68_20475 [Deltaproteobacteria bacterium]|nr:hypothetical protein [Deltaproteobacteria bacterium]